MSEIKINADDWNKVSDEDKKKIIEILKNSGLLLEEDKIVADPKEPPVR